MAIADSSHAYSCPQFLIAFPEMGIEASPLIYDWVTWGKSHFLL